MVEQPISRVYNINTQEYTSGKLWCKLKELHPNECDRVESTIFPLPGASKDEDLCKRIEELSINTGIADGRSGFIGNPYEQPAKDFMTLSIALNDLSKNT